MTAARLLAFVAALLFAIPARAQEPTNRIDKAFGDWVVAPLSAVLFFDVWFWDDRLPAGQGVGLVVGDQEVAGWTADEGYTLLQREEVSIDSLGEGPWVAGMRVGRYGQPWDILAVGDGKATLRATVGTTDPSRLPNPANTKVPIVVAWLAVGMVFFTVRMRFVQAWAFGHAVRVTMGDYDNPEDPGEISHFQALASALSGTIGLGNIAGVAIAVGLGGPGAVFWMTMAGLFGMASKFNECTLGQLYRKQLPDGSVSGGPMHYLELGLAEMGARGFGKVLAVVFAVMCMGGSLGGGNMFQANQAFAAVEYVVPFFQGRGWLFGLLTAGAVGIVIIGGIKRIAAASSFVVPFMIAIYMAAGMFIVAVHASAIPGAFAVIFREAFTPSGAWGGVVGVATMGIRRAAFSNEAGIGSASIAHSAAATKYGVREGIVGLLEPFIDTVVVCNMTGIIVIVTGAYLDKGDGSFSRGVVMTSQAFATVLPWFPFVLTVAVVLFAYATMLSWSYYGERCATWLFGPRASLPFRMLFCFATFFGCIVPLANVLEFSDLMILGMAFPNLIGAMLLSGRVKAALDDYWARYRAGEFPVYRRARPAPT